MSTSQKNTNKKRQLFHAIAFDKQKIQSLTFKLRLSQLLGRYMFTVFYLNTSLYCIRCVL